MDVCLRVPIARNCHPTLGLAPQRSIRELPAGGIEDTQNKTAVVQSKQRRPEGSFLSD